MNFPWKIACLAFMAISWNIISFNAGRVWCYSKQIDIAFQAEPPKSGTRMTYYVNGEDFHKLTFFNEGWEYEVTPSETGYGYTITATKK